MPPVATFNRPAAMDAVDGSDHVDRIARVSIPSPPPSIARSPQAPASLPLPCNPESIQDTAEASVTPPAEMPAATPNQRRAVSPVKRAVLVGLGVLCVGLAALGVLLPGMPTTVFLIGASWCFARSCPWLEDRLIRNRFFRPFLVYLEPGTPMPRKARVVALVMMWTAIAFSSWLFVARDQAWAMWLVVGLGVLGSAVILTIRRPPEAKQADGQNVCK